MCHLFGFSHPKLFSFPETSPSFALSCLSCSPPTAAILLPAPHKSKEEKWRDNTANVALDRNEHKWNVLKSQCVGCPIFGFECDKKSKSCHLHVNLHDHIIRALKWLSHSPAHLLVFTQETGIEMVSSFDQMETLFISSGEESANWAGAGGRISQESHFWKCDSTQNPDACFTLLSADAAKCELHGTDTWDDQH